MAIPSSTQHMFNEVRLQYFGELPFPDLQNTALVCQTWFKVSCDEVLWRPIFNSLSQQYTCNEGEAIKSAVLRNLHEDQKFTDQIIALIDDDLQFADVIGCPLETVQRFPQMLPIERSWHVIRSLRRNTALLIERLPYFFSERLKSHLREKMPNEDNTQEAKQRCALEFHSQDACVPIFFRLLDKPLGPFDASKALSAAIKLHVCCGSSSEEGMKTILKAIGAIATSHADLSLFFNGNVKFRSRQGVFISMSARDCISEVIIPFMEQYQVAVPLEDWKKCGYKPPG
jgi:hypothetical protein